MAEKLFEQLATAVVEMEEEEVVDLSHQVIEQGLDAYDAIDQGLSEGMSQASDLFEEEEYFVPELLSCADAMYAGIDVLRPHIRQTESEGIKSKVVLGVVEGDTHDIGKNLVKMMLETSGFNVVDLGRDVPPAVFVERAIEENADIIGMSTLMTTNMEAMEEVIRILNEKGIRERFKIMIGGGPISQSYANRIGADGYSSDATEAVRLARRLVGSREVC